MVILAYLMRPQGRNAASPQAGTEIEQWKARSTALYLISASLCICSLSCKLIFLVLKAQDGIQLPVLSLKLKLEANGSCLSFSSNTKYRENLMGLT